MNLTVLLYSSSPDVRERIRGALGDRPARDLPAVTYVEAGTAAEALRIAGDGVHLAILDGEAWPTGGMGLARQFGDELAYPPPSLVIVAREDDAWLATWSRAEAVSSFPLDPVRLTEAVVRVLRRNPALS